MDPHDRHRLAVHEAGHFVLAAANQLKPYRLTIDAHDGKAGGCYWSVADKERGVVAILAGPLASAEYLGIEIHELSRAELSADLAKVSDLLAEQHDRLRDVTPGSCAWFADPDIQSILVRASSSLQVNADLLDEMVERLLIVGEIVGTELREFVCGVSIDRTWSRQRDAEVKQEIAKMREKHAKRIGEARRKHPGDRGFHSRFCGGFATTEERDRMLARCGVGADKFGPRGVAAAQRILTEHKQLIRKAK